MRRVAWTALFSAYLQEQALRLSTLRRAVVGAPYVVARHRRMRVKRRRRVPERCARKANRDRIFLGDERQILVARTLDSRTRGDPIRANQSSRPIRSARF
jgi:hypothetical protein